MSGEPAAMTTAKAGQDVAREPLSGVVERVTFHSAETGYCVLGSKCAAIAIS